ncbi:MAG TPA: tripartite tricarboxylate transporter substrate binding protein [Usitatibacteraceae bacterium]|nr:tripartite tricarboxylate transporter substrate binding protein [Usitatibacteraceae bacterium]
MSRIVLAALAALALLSPSVQAQGDFPSRPVTILVGFAAGGATDTAARIVAKKLSENLGVSVVVENKPGAGGNIVHHQMATANPDGYTILLGSVGPLSVAPHLVAKLPYDPLKDLAPLTMAVNFPNVLVVHAGVPAKSLAEYIALAKSKPGGLDYASTGVGSASHLAGELFNQRAGVDIVHIPYKGGGPAMTDLLGGRVSTYYSTHSTAGPHIETGKLRPLAVTGAKRSSFLPNVPTIAESGFPGFEASNWYAFVTSAKVPAPILERWNKELVKALTAPDVKEQLAKHFLEPAPGTREELAAYIKQEYDNWGRVVKKANIQAN